MDLREEIIKDATGIFIRDGVKSQNMDLIAKKMKRSKKTLYRFFNNKAHLVKEVIINFIKEQKRKVNKITKSGYNSIDEMAFIYEFNFHMISNINPFTISDIKNYYPAAWKLFLEYKFDFVYNIILLNIKKGKLQNLYRNDINDKILAMYYTIRVDDIFDSTFLNFKNFSIKNLLSEIFTYHIRGLASKEGINYFENEFDRKQFKYL